MVAGRTFWKLDAESNPPTWFSSSLLLLAAALLAIFAWGETRRPARGAADRLARLGLWLAAAGVAFLSLDEIAMLHEKLGFALDLLRGRPRAATGLPQTGAWVLVCLPAALIAGGLVAWLARPWWTGRPKVVLLYVLGTSIFLGAGGGLELLSNLFDPAGPWAHAEVVLEEVGEMIGVTLWVWAGAELLTSHGYGLRVP